MGEGFNNWRHVSKHVREKLDSAVRATEWKQGDDPDQRFSILSSGLGEHDRDFTEEGGLVAYLQNFNALRNRTPRVLDYGCGTNQLGRDLFEALGSKVIYTGISAGDPRSQDEEKFDASHGIGFINQTQTTFPETGSFDLIVSRTTFLHLPDPLRVLRQMYTHLVDDGEIRVKCSEADIAKGFYDGKNREKADGDARIALSKLKSLGIDIEISKGLLRIRKSAESPRDLPFGQIFSYAPVVDDFSSNRIYVLKE